MGDETEDCLSLPARIEARRASRKSEIQPWPRGATAEDLLYLARSERSYKDYSEPATLNKNESNLYSCNVQVLSLDNNLIKIDPGKGYASLPSAWDDLEDDGLYDDFIWMSIIRNYSKQY